MLHVLKLEAGFTQSLEFELIRKSFESEFCSHGKPVAITLRFISVDDFADHALALGLSMMIVYFRFLLPC